MPKQTHQRVLFPRTLMQYAARGFVVLVLIAAFLPVYTYTREHLRGSTAYAAAGINKQINFQGKLVNPDGTNVTDGSYSIVFSIYTVASGGAAVWTETQSTVSLSNGIFQVSLGSVTALPGSVDFNTDNIYLGVKVGADLEMTPRIRFGAVPQAFNAEKLGGLDKTGFIQNQTASAQSAGLFIQAASGVTATIQGVAGQNIMEIKNSAGTTVSSFTSTGDLKVAANIDTSTATTLGVGNSTATAVSICNSAACDTIQIGTNADADAIQVGDASDTITITGGSGSTFVLAGTTIDTTEFNLLNGKDTALVDTTDAVATAITGTGALTAGSINWSGGIATSGNISTSGTGTITSVSTVQGTRLISTIATGTAPLTVASTTVVTNLNADLLDGQQGSYYQNASNINAGTLGVGFGGTGLTSYTTGDLLYASGTTTIGKLAAVAVGNCLRSAGTGTAPTWGSCSGTGDILQDGNSFTSLMTIGTNDAYALNLETANTARFQIAAGASTLTGQGTTTLTSTGTLALETTGASAITVGGTNTTGITLNKNVTIASQQTIRFVGGTTAQRPASPTEGMLYYDTDTHQLLQYNNSKWVSDRNTATKIVAASNSSQAVKDAADYVAGATNAHTTINTALTAAAGGKVYLAEGTYTLGGSISIPNNTTLAGAGQGTLITIPNSYNTAINAIINTTGSGNGTGITIQDLKLDGNKANQTTGSMIGIYFDGVGSGIGSSAIQGAKITNIIARNWRTYGFYFYNTSNGTYAGNTVQANDSGFIFDGSSSNNNNTFTGNIAQGNANIGLAIYYGYNNTLTGNIAQGNANIGLAIYYGYNNTLTGNTAQGNAYSGFNLYSSSNNTLTGNTAQGNAVAGFYIVNDSNNNTITGNTITDSGGSTNNDGIYLNYGDDALPITNNTITNNTITDTDGHSSTDYAINISDFTSYANYLADNTLGGGSINDDGTGNIYGGQNNGTSFLIQPAQNITIGSGSTTTTIQGNTAVTLSGTTGTTMVCRNGSGYLSSCDASYLAPTATNFIQNQNASDQTANLRISGTVRANTSVLTPLVDTASAVALNIGTTNATQINLNKNTVITGSITQSGADFSLMDGGTQDSTAVRVFSAGGNLYLQNGSGNSTIFRSKTAGTTATLDNSGNFSAIGTVNSSTALQTAGTTRVDASGNLTNIGTITASGNISTTGGNISTASGVVLQGGYQAADAATDNMLVNGDFERNNTTGWSGLTNIVTGGYSGNYAARVTGGPQTVLSDDYIPVDPTRDVLQLEAYIKKSVAGTTPGQMYFGYQAFDASKALITSSPCGTYCYFAAAGYTFSDSNWHKFSATTTGEGTSSPNFPVGTKYVRVLGLINYGASADAVTLIDHVSVRRINNGALFVGNNFNSTNMNDQYQQTQLYTTSGGVLTIDGATGGTNIISGPLQMNGTTRLTIAGILQNVTYNGNSIADGYLDDNLTISSSGNVAWTALSSYPGACTAGQAITQLGDTITCSSFATGSASSYIQNQNASQQSSATFWIQNAGRSDTSFQAPLFDTPTAVALNIGTTNATSINLNKNVVVASQQTIRFIGGTTAQRPASPTEGMLYYDTDTHQLLQYNNSKWVSDRSTATKIVAASNSSQAIKDAADYVAGATNAHTTINTALTAAAGGKVYLAEGTYNLGGSISIPNNTTLAGAGQGTLITIPNSYNTAINAIINTTGSGNGTGITIQDLKLDGNKANQATGSMTGIYFDGVGSGTGASAIQGAKITNIVVKNWRDNGFYFNNTSNGTYAGNTAQANNGGGLIFEGSSSNNNNTFTGNTAQGNAGVGLAIYYGYNNALTGNTAQGNHTGLDLSFSSNNTLTGNTAQGNSIYGFNLSGCNNNTLTGNTAQGNGTGLYLGSSSNNTLTGNTVTDSGGSANNNGIYLFDSDSNTVTSNTITDTDGHSSTNYAINISNSTSDTNYLADNTLGGGTINDAGTGTIFGGQLSDVGNYVVQSNALQVQTATAQSVLVADTIKGAVVSGVASTSDTLTKLTNPATLPTVDSKGTAFSPDGQYMSVAHDTSPYVTIYKRSGDTFTKLANPATLPAGTAYGTAFSPDGQYMSVAHNNSPFVTIYKRSGDTFTKLADPATLPAGAAIGTAFSPDGQYMSVAHNNSPFVTIYKRSGDTFTKLADPATLPTNNALGTAFSPDGQYMSVAHVASPYITIYKRSGDTFTKLANPVTLPTDTGRATAFSPDGQYMSVAHQTSPFVTIYKRSGDTFTKLADPATLPTNTAFGTAFSPDGQYMSVAHQTSPFVTIYKRSGDTFTKLTNPATLPTGNGWGTAFSPDGQYMSVGHATSPDITIYRVGNGNSTSLTVNGGVTSTGAVQAGSLNVTGFTNLYGGASVTGALNLQGESTFLQTSETAPALVVKGKSSPSLTTADILQVNDTNGNTILAATQSYGNVVRIGGGSGFWGSAALQVYSAESGAAAGRFVGASGQTADILQVQDNGGNNQFSVGPTGINRLRLSTYTWSRTPETIAASYTDATVASSYVISSDSTTTNGTFNTTMNLTGLGTNSGTTVFVTVKATKGITPFGTTHSTVFQIGGTTISTVTTAAVTTASTNQRSFIVTYLDGAWRVMGTGLTAAPGATSSTVNTADYAEWISYSGDEQPQPGEVLVVGDDAKSVKRSTVSYDQRIIGVVSTDPYQVAGADDGHSVILALTGRVPVRVSLENGPIHKGDLLTSSSTPGVAMKALHAGKVIGTALEDYDGTQTDNLVTVQLQVGYDVPDPDTGDTGASTGLQGSSLSVTGDALIDGNVAVGGSLNVSGAATVSALTVTGNATVQGSLVVLGNIETRNITINGHIITAGDAPVVAVGSGAGVQDQQNNIAAPVVTVEGNDTSGTVTITAGANGIVDALANITFNEPFGAKPRIVLTPANHDSASLGAYYDAAATTTTGFNIMTTQAPQAGKTYTFTYFIVQ